MVSYRQNGNGYSSNPVLGTTTLTNNLVAYWRMEEASGNRIDSTGGGSTLTAVNGPISTVGKIASSALLVKASSQSLQRTTGPNTLNQSADFTVTLWVNPSSAHGTNDYVWCNGTNQVPAFFINPGNSGVFTFGTGTNAIGDAVSIGSWHFVACRYNATTFVGEIRVDGGNWITGTSTSPTPTGTGILFGIRNDGTRIWDGAVDEAGLWSRRLSDAEVTQLYNMGQGLTYPFV